MDRVEGGTVLPISDFWMGSARGGHTSEQKGRPVSGMDMEATNTLSRTGWQINTRVLDTAREMWELGHPSMGFDPGVPPMMPPKIVDETYKAMSEAERRVYHDARGDAHGALKGWMSISRATADLLNIASEDAEHPELFILWGHDARLRRYARVSNGPGPQGSGLSKALLQFSRGKPLGSRGLYWLAVRAATCAGLDKLDHDARAAWADKHTEDLLGCARAPLAYDFWWKDREDPWGLLATCYELNDAMTSGDPAGFLSKLPVNIDATCSGLQHFSALGLDPFGAKSVNLTSDPNRNDIYADVARIVADKVDRDASDGLVLAHLWVGKVDRSRVKRGVMTTAYSVTQRGMRDQLLDESDVPGETQQERNEAASYLRDLMWEAIGEVVVSARAIMDWLQTLATELGNAGLPFRWQVPTGSTIQQAYRPWVAVRPITAFGQVVVASSLDKTGLKVRKGAMAAAPNFVHSFDAAHMALTVLKASERGVTHFSMIHDSFGTHAADMDVMAATLREEFVAIYLRDWLKETYEFAQADAPHLALTPPPARGDFDVRQVLSSPWFFA